jgi:thermopsin
MDAESKMSPGMQYSPAWRRSIQAVLICFVTVLLASMVIPGAGAPGAPSPSTGVSGAGPTTDLPTTAPIAVHTAIPSGEVALLQQRIAQDERNPALPRADLLVPNLAYSDVREGSAVVPTNLAQGSVSPGPTSIGVNDLGLRVNSFGSFVPYSYRTTSLDGTISINNISLLPIENNASSSITLQLNAILNNVTFFGQSVYQIWAQNVIFYSVEGNQMQLATDAWNFTGAPFALFQNDIYQNSPGGFLFGGTYVHAVPSHPPAFILRPPFSISFYLNATNIAGRNALFFNYSLTSAHDITLGHTDLGRVINDGSFDWIIFNSTAGMPRGYRAPPASFLISGSTPSNLGLPNDAEIAICGGSDGFSAITRSLNASAQLQYLNASTGGYSAVPAAFTTTEDTGESMEGVDAHFTSASAASGTALLTNGPEFIYGLWNASAPGIRESSFSVTATPASTLLWVSPRAKNGQPAFTDSQAAWDLAPSAQTTFWLPTGPGLHFTVEGLANDYTPRTAYLKPGTVTSVDLTLNVSEGLYVPVIAFGNAGIAAIASGGTGSAAHPYILAFTQTQPISELFSAYDTFTEPLYPGMLLSGVTAHVVIRDLPNLRVQQSFETLQVLEEFYGLSIPNFNDLPVEIYDSSNISLVGAHDIAGWFPATLTGFLMASLFLSNDTHLLVAHDYFSSMGSSMVIVSPNGNRTLEDNTVFGNTFVTNPLMAGPHASSLYQVLAFNTTYTGPIAPGGLGVFSSGNTIYNNLFETPITAYSPPQNPYLAYVFINDFGYTDFASVAAVWHNEWNVPLEGVGAVQIVNGFALTGSIVGAQFQGGNAWGNWNGALPYTDQGLIVGGGDALPLPIPGAGFQAVLFQESGLPTGTGWFVTVGGVSYSTSQSSILVYEPAGSYTFSVASIGVYTPHPQHGTLHLGAHDVSLRITFT